MSVSHCYPSFKDFVLTLLSERQKIHAYDIQKVYKDNYYQQIILHFVNFWLDQKRNQTIENAEKNDSNLGLAVWFIKVYNQ